MFLTVALIQREATVAYRLILHHIHLIILISVQCNANSFSFQRVKGRASAVWPVKSWVLVC